MIVRAAHQGQGLGLRLMRWAIDVAGERSLMLNATDSGLGLYEKLGFQAVGTVCQHQAVVTGVPECQSSDALRPARHTDMPRLLELSNAATGLDRGRILDDLCAVARRVLVVEDAGRIQAFGISRAFGRGYHVGSLVATRVEHAHEVLAALLADLEGEFVRLDCPENSGLEGLLRAAGLERVGAVKQMVRGGRHEPSGAHQFALITQALG